VPDPFLEEHVKHRAVRVHRPPEVVGPAGDPQMHLIQVPVVAGMRSSPPEVRGEEIAKLQALPPIVSYDAALPCIASISSTSRYLMANRKYKYTAWLMIAGGKRCRQYQDEDAPTGPSVHDLLIVRGPAVNVRVPPV
jgi:hypothetical protein